MPKLAMGVALGLEVVRNEKNNGKDEDGEAPGQNEVGVGWLQWTGG